MHFQGVLSLFGRKTIGLRADVFSKILHSKRNDEILHSTESTIFVVQIILVFEEEEEEENNVEKERILDDGFSPFITMLSKARFFSSVSVKIHPSY